MRNAYIVVEGPHDIEVVARLLPSLGRVRKLSELPAAWQVLVPRKYPYDDDLLKRVPVPTFFASADGVLAVHAAGGRARLVATLAESLALLAPGFLDGIGIIVDADGDAPKALQEVSEAWSKEILRVPTPSIGGVVSPGPPAHGIFALPNNVDAGAAENVLLESGATSYPISLTAARSYVRSIVANGELTQSELRDVGKPFGEDKATLAALVAVLRPGKALQVSIQDNRWLDAAGRIQPLAAGLEGFVRALVGLP